MAGALDGGAVFLFRDIQVLVFFRKARLDPVRAGGIHGRNLLRLGKRFIFAAAEQGRSFQVKLRQIGARVYVGAV